MKIVGIIQARMGSTRLPGKVMMDLAGKTMLERTVDAVTRARSLDEVVVATSTKQADDVIAECCRQKGWPCFRGSEEDVLDRYYHAAKWYEADTIVRITSDCPLMDPGLIDYLVNEFLYLQPVVAYACNTVPVRTYPRGQDIEVIRFDALERSWMDDRNPAWREHVTQYIINNPQQFSMHCVVSSQDCSDLRWTVDTEKDLELVRLIFQHFGEDTFHWTDVLELIDECPELSEINGEVYQKPIAESAYC